MGFYIVLLVGKVVFNFFGRIVIAKTACLLPDPNRDPNAETCGNDETPPDGMPRDFVSCPPAVFFFVLRGSFCRAKRISGNTAHRQERAFQQSSRRFRVIEQRYYSVTPSLKMAISLAPRCSALVCFPLAIASTKSKSRSPAASRGSPSATEPALKSIQLPFFS